eukprot:472334-Alexandrium_andersonii.AAC.1
MSASLVGSEMCIRDRFKQTPSRGEGRLARRASWGRDLLGWILGRPGQPVSYTHLTLPTICSV